MTVNLTICINPNLFCLEEAGSADCLCYFFLGRTSFYNLFSPPYSRWMQPSGAPRWCVILCAEATQLIWSQSGQSQEENHRFVLVNRCCQPVFVCVEGNSGEGRFLRTSAVSLHVCQRPPLWVWLDRCLWKACGSTRNTPPTTTATPWLLLTLCFLFLLVSSTWYSDHKMCHS